MVEGDEDGEHHGKGPKGRATIAHKRKRNAYDRHNADSHTYIYEQVHKKTAGEAVTVNPCELLSAALRITYDLQNHQHVKRNH